MNDIHLAVVLTEPLRQFIKPRTRHTPTRELLKPLGTADMLILEPGAVIVRVGHFDKQALSSGIAKHHGNICLTPDKRRVEGSRLSSR
jgi:hypothetical protein